MINIRSTLRTPPDLCKNVSISVLFVTTVIHIQSLRSQICVHIYTYSSQYRDAGRAKEIKKFGQREMPRAKKIFPLAILGTGAIDYCVLPYVLLACIGTSLPSTPGF